MDKLKKLAIIIAAMLSLSGSRVAQVQGFTAAEVASIGKLREAGRANRAALRALEVVIASRVAADTRETFGLLEHSLGEGDEHLVNGTFYVLGAAAEPSDVERDRLRALPRSEFLVRAKRELGIAAFELLEARDLAIAAKELRKDDPGYQLQLDRTIFFITQAGGKLAAFDGELAYATPGGRSTLVQDEAFEGLGQYGYGIADVLITQWGALPQGTDYRAFAGVLSQFWLLQDIGMDVAFRAAGVIGGGVEVSREAMLGGGTGTVNQRFNGIMVNLIALRKTVGEALDFDRVLSRFGDSWRHEDRMIGEDLADAAGQAVVGFSHNPPKKVEWESLSYGSFCGQFIHTTKEKQGLICAEVGIFSEITCRDLCPTQ